MPSRFTGGGPLDGELREMEVDEWGAPPQEFIATTVAPKGHGVAMQYHRYEARAAGAYYIYTGRVQVKEEGSDDGE